MDILEKVAFLHHVCNLLLFVNIHIFIYIYIYKSLDRFTIPDYSGIVVGLYRDYSGIIVGL